MKRLMFVLIVASGIALTGHSQKPKPVMPRPTSVASDTVEWKSATLELWGVRTIEIPRDMVPSEEKSLMNAPGGRIPRDQFLKSWERTNGTSRPANFMVNLEIINWH